MKTQSIDTDPITEKVLLPLAKKAIHSKKLSPMAIQLSKKALIRTNNNKTALFFSPVSGSGTAQNNLYDCPDKSANDKDIPPLSHGDHNVIRAN